jgi:hypothetical protein
MLRATVRSGHEAVHFIGDLNGYNLQTLQLHARGALKESGSALVELELDESDAQTWQQYAQRWLARMDRAGVSVLVRAETGGVRGPARREPSVAA